MGKRSIKDDILDEIETYHRFHVFTHPRLINLTSEVNLEDGDEYGVGFSMSTAFMKNMSILESLSSDPITVILNTQGGDIVQGMAIYDTIIASKCHVTIIVRGAAMSMGSIILQAGDERILSPNAAIMFHAGGGGCGGNNPDENVHSAVFDKMFSKKCDDILYARINEKRAKDNQAPMARKTFDLMNLKGRYMFAEEALELGLATKIETQGQVK